MKPKQLMLPGFMGAMRTYSQRRELSPLAKFYVLLSLHDCSYIDTARDLNVTAPFLYDVARGNRRITDRILDRIEKALKRLEVQDGQLVE